MSKEMPKTPLLDQLEDGTWPSFVSGLKRLAQSEDKQYAGMMKDLLGQLEHSYETRKGYWKGGTVGVKGYGAGVIPRFSEVASEYPESAEFHTLRVMPPAGMHYTTDMLRKMCDIWETYGSGLIALHGQSGDIMFQGCKTENVQPAFDELNKLGFDLGGAGAGVRTSVSCVGAARCEQSCYDEAKALRTMINAFLDDMHRPSLPYKF
ncbi:MAG TPA: sulfite reductase, dissimilatory-type subunit alpha, partial [Azospirillum sp.]|nr:sulfite reductase, dissimilatory-type subunit alpha [Azospirillum sp.]